MGTCTFQTAVDLLIERNKLVSIYDLVPVRPAVDLVLFAQQLFAKFVKDGNDRKLKLTDC